MTLDSESAVLQELLVSCSGPEGGPKARVCVAPDATMLGLDSSPLATGPDAIAAALAVYVQALGSSDLRVVGQVARPHGALVTLSSGSVDCRASVTIQDGRIIELRGPFRLDRPPFAVKSSPAQLMGIDSAPYRALAARATYLGGLSFDRTGKAGTLSWRRGVIRYTPQGTSIDRAHVVASGPEVIWGVEIVEPGAAAQLARRAQRTVVGGLIGAALTGGDVPTTALAALLGYSAGDMKQRGLALGIEMPGGEKAAGIWVVDKADAFALRESLIIARRALGLPPPAQRVEAELRAEDQPRGVPAQVAPRQPGHDDRIQLLRDLAQLASEGVITPEEFERKKDEVLRGL